MFKTFSQVLISLSVVAFFFGPLEASPSSPSLTGQEPNPQVLSSVSASEENEAIDASSLDENTISDMTNKNPNRLFFCDTRACNAVCTAGGVSAIPGCSFGTVPTSGRCCRFLIFSSICKCVFANCPAPAPC